MVNFNPYRILRKDLTKTRRVKGSRYETCSVSWIHFHFPGRGMIAPLTELLFLTALSTVTAHEIPWQPPRTSLNSMKTREIIAGNRRPRKIVLSLEPVQMMPRTRPMVTTSCDEIPSVVFFHRVFHVEFLALFPADEISLTNFMEIPDINSRIATRIALFILPSVDTIRNG